MTINTNKKSANAVLDRLKNALQLDSDSEPCRHLDLNRAALGNWRSRDSVPYTLCVNVAEENKIDLNWLLTGEMLKRNTLDESFSEEDVRILRMIKRLPEPQKKKEIADIDVFLQSFDEAVSHWVANNQGRHQATMA